jgi:hypothetical protein
MAKQKSIIKLKGTLGDITFVKTSDGYGAREKTSLDGARIASDPNFQRTRENMAEFATAGKGSKLVRTAFQSEMQDAKDSRTTSRLTGAMIKVLQEDTTNNRGSRQIATGNLHLLEGFEFNLNSKLATTLFAPYTSTIDRLTGSLGVSFEAFIPNQVVCAPKGTTHFRIITAGAEIDFDSGTFKAGHNDSGILPWSQVSSGVIELVNNVTANTTSPLFIILGVHFYQEVNGVQYPLKNGAFNPLTIIKVSDV